MTSPTTRPLVRLDLRGDTDVIALRRLGREAGGLLGLDRQDQVRFATALSELGREVVATGRGEATLTVATAPRDPVLVATLVATGALPPPPPGAIPGVEAAGRLVDSAEVETQPDGGTQVRLRKRLPGDRLTAAAVERVRRALSTPRTVDAMDELRVQNAELLSALDDLRAREQELTRLNAELEETNRGVVAMYTQLSDELEETNSGVVALYAELDERGRQLAAANDAKTRFLRNVSHELRAPVNSILGLASLLADNRLDADQRVQIGYLDASAHTLLTMVNELLDLARAESGRQHVRRAPVDVAELLTELEGTASPLLRPGVRLEVQPPAEPLVVHTDRELLSRVLRNLLSNAAKFTDQGTVRLTADVSPVGEGLVVTVQDTGLGIPADQLEQVFEEFVQVPNRLQPTVKGSGLGLAYARRVTEALGGALTTASEPGVGSTFTLTLWRTAAPAVGRVLVVDDDAAYRAVLRGLLQPLAADVLEASDGAEALETMRTTVPDAVLMDVRMPGLDGPATLEAIRADPVLRDIRVVLMSSVDDPGSTDVPVLRKADLDGAVLADVLTDARTGRDGEGR